MTITIDTTIGELVRAAPVRARIFEKLGVDYCCGGKKALSEICRAKGLDPATVLALLAALDVSADESLIDADALGLDALCDHIEAAHHNYLREELPRLDFMTRKVAAVHGDHEPRLVEIRQVFAQLAPELADHIVDEEQRVFPSIRRLAAHPTEAGRVDLREALQELESEH